jgi:hypothetical protein
VAASSFFFGGLATFYPIYGRKGTQETFLIFTLLLSFQKRKVSFEVKFLSSRVET